MTPLSPDSFILLSDSDFFFVIMCLIFGFQEKNGNYFYEDCSYSIFNVSIKDSALLSRVLKLIFELQSEIDHPEMVRDPGSYLKLNW